MKPGVSAERRILQLQMTYEKLNLRRGRPPGSYLPSPSLPLAVQMPCLPRSRRAIILQLPLPKPGSNQTPEPYCHASPACPPPRTSSLLPHNRKITIPEPPSALTAYFHFACRKVRPFCTPSHSGSKSREVRIYLGTLGAWEIGVEACRAVEDVGFGSTRL